jgi:hypothetical protein
MRQIPPKGRSAYITKHVPYPRRCDFQIYHRQSLTSSVKHLFKKYFNIPCLILGMTYNFVLSMTTLKKVT